MKRMKVMFGNRRMVVLLTLAILVLAATALVASSASFTASSTNVHNDFTAGALTLNDTTKVLSFPAVKLMPNHNIQGTTTITTNSDGTYDVYLKWTALADTPAVAGHPLSDVLTLTVTDGATTWNYNVRDLVVGNGVKVASDVAGSRTTTYTLTVAFPNGDTGTLATAGADNFYQNALTTIGFQFVAVSK